MIEQSIMAALKSRYPDYAIYCEVVQQDFTPPCFVVLLLTTSYAPQLGQRYYKATSYDIQGFPQVDDLAPNNTLGALGEALLETLALIPFGEGLIRGTQMRYEIIDGVLHFFVDYNHFGYKTREEAPPMIDLTLGGKLKG